MARASPRPSIASPASPPRHPGTIEMFGVDAVKDYREARRLIGLSPAGIQCRSLRQRRARSWTGWAAISACARRSARARIDMLIERFDLVPAPEQAVPRIVRRTEAPRDPGARAGPRSQAADPRRADRGRGCGIAPRSVALSAGTQPRRHDHPAHLALSGGSGAAVPHHRHRRKGKHRAQRPQGRILGEPGGLEARLSHRHRRRARPHRGGLA